MVYISTALLGMEQPTLHGGVQAARRPRHVRLRVTKLTDGGAHFQRCSHFSLHPDSLFTAVAFSILLLDMLKRSIFRTNGVCRNTCVEEQGSHVSTGFQFARVQSTWARVRQYSVLDKDILHILHSCLTMNLQDQPT